jgi:hypothetical protein
MLLPLICLGLALLAFALHYPWPSKKSRLLYGNDHLKRRHREINRKHLGHHGSVLPQALYCIGALALAHAVVFALHFIVMTVMGMQEPRW